MELFSPEVNRSHYVGICLGDVGGGHGPGGGSALLYTRIHTDQEN